MAHRQQKAAVVSRTQLGVTLLLQAMDLLRGERRIYDALGNATDFFLDPETNQPRTDLPFTEAEYADALSSVGAIEALLAQGHATNLAKLRQ